MWSSNTVLMLALVGLALTAQTTYGVGVVTLTNGTLVSNNAPPGSKDDIGITTWNNGTTTPYGPPGIKVTNFTQFTNATGTYGSATFHVGPKPADNESSGNVSSGDSRGNLTDPSTEATPETNEHDYKFGFKWGFGDYIACADPNSNCDRPDTNAACKYLSRQFKHGPQHSRGWYPNNQ